MKDWGFVNLFDNYIFLVVFIFFMCFFLVKLVIMNYAK